MSYIENERGNAAIFLLWLLGIVAILFIVTINIVKVYVVKEQANMAVEQAALAGTAVLLDKTKEAVKEFDTNPLYLLESEVQLIADGKSVSALIDDKQTDLMRAGWEEADAYIEAANEILPEKVQLYVFLKHELRDALTGSGFELSQTVERVLDNNNARLEDTEYELSNADWRVEVKSTVRFESISDNKYIKRFFEDIPQIGYGPTLKYLENVYR